MDLEDWIRRFFLLSVLCLTYGSPAPINNSTLLFTLRDDFSNPTSKCVFPPRDMFQDVSPYNGLCSNMSAPAGSNFSALDTNSSLCFALRFVSDKLCTNESVIEFITPGVAKFPALLTSNVNITAENFCNEFQKSVMLNPNESLPDMDGFFQSFFNTIVNEKNDIGANLCVKSCKSSNQSLGINALCTLTNAGFEIMKFYLQSAKLDTNTAEGMDSPKALEVSSKNNQVPLPAPAQPPVVKQEPAGVTAVESPGRPEDETISKPDLAPGDIQPDPVSKEPSNKSMIPSLPEKEKTNDVQPQPLPNDIGGKSGSEGDPLSAGNGQSQAQSASSSPATPSSDKELPGNQVKPPSQEKSEVADLGKSSSPTLDDKEEVLDDESEELLPPDRSSQTTLDQNKELDPKEASNLDGKKKYDFNSQAQPVKNFNSFENTAAGEDMVEEESPGYFGYFLTFIGISCIIFIMFHNKKRLIALVVEGRKPRGGRRRSGSGSAAYRKLENNFE